MTRIFHHHDVWEDARAGLYRLPSIMDEWIAQLNSRLLLRTPHAFFRIAMEMVDGWPKSSEANLSNRSRNRQAWIGQATCCFAFGAAEHQVKAAWHELTLQEQSDANHTADEVIVIWEIAHNAKEKAKHERFGGCATARLLDVR
jgi:hypothetical protein